MAHILIVDDEKDLVWTVTQGFHFQGHTVSVAYDGLAACRRKGGFGKVFVEPCRFCVHLDVQGGII